MIKTINKNKWYEYQRKQGIEVKKKKRKKEEEMIKQENNRNMYGSLNKQAFTIVSLLIFKVDEW
jgi:hypothetical protein